MKQKVVAALVGGEEHTALHVKARQAGVALSDVMRRLLMAWLGGAVELPEKSSDGRRE